MNRRLQFFDRALLYGLAIAMIVIITMGAKSAFNPSRIAFVDIGKMLEGYKFKKGLETSSGGNLTHIKSVIDSLQMIRKTGMGTPAIDTQLARAKYAFRQYYVQSNEEITKKVWERLNPLMEQYGKERGLRLLIGATGTGTVLYGDKASDVTVDLTNYINQKFEKGN